jgi:hypothetical protein
MTFVDRIFDDSLKSQLHGAVILPTAAVLCETTARRN